MFDSLFFLLGPVGTAGALLVLLGSCVGTVSLVSGSPRVRRMQRV
jgi:hypothetical protein